MTSTGQKLVNQLVCFVINLLSLMISPVVTLELDCIFLSTGECECVCMSCVCVLLLCVCVLSTYKRHWHRDVKPVSIFCPVDTIKG